MPELGPGRASSCRREGEERSVSVIDSCGRGHDGDAPAAAVTKTQPAARMNPLSSSALDLGGSQGEVWSLEGIIVSSGPVLTSNCLISDLCRAGPGHTATLQPGAVTMPGTSLCWPPVTSSDLQWPLLTYSDLQWPPGPWQVTLGRDGQQLRQTATSSQPRQSSRWKVGPLPLAFRRQLI